METSSVAEGEYDHIFKVITLGDKQCGKTSLLRSFCYKAFCKNVKTTVGIDFHVCDTTVVYQEKSVKVRLQLWDTSGEERYRSISSVYYRNAEGVVALMDVTCKQTFDNIPSWLSGVYKHCNEAITVLVANKCDLDACVSSTEISQFANDKGLQWIMTSAKDATNVDQLFQQLAVQLVTKRFESVLESYAFVPASVVLTHRGRNGGRKKNVNDTGTGSEMGADRRTRTVAEGKGGKYFEGQCCSYV